MRRLLLSLFSCVSIGMLPAASAQSSDKTIRIVVPFGAGGVQDGLARSLNAEFGEAMKQPVIVENKAGAGGTIGTAYVAKSAPDGLTLDMAAASHNIGKYLYSKLSYDPIKDFAPAAYVGNASYVLMVPGDLPVNNVAEYIKFIKASPGKYNYSSAGNGSATHLAMAYFAGMAGLQMEHIPTKSTGEAVMEVLSGRSQGVIAANIGALGYKNDKRVKLLAVTSPGRSKFITDLPSASESGLPGYEFTSWFGLLAPAGTPKPTLDKMQAAMAETLKNPVVVERLQKQGIEHEIIDNAKFAEILNKFDKQMEQVVKMSGAKVQ